MHRLDFQKRRDLPSAPPDDLRQALRQFASGVTVVTAEHDGERYGITVSAFTSISLDPPVIMVSINTSSRLAPLIVDAEHFAVNILGAEQEDLSSRFASAITGPEKYDGIESAARLSGAPIILGALAVFDCVLDQTLLVGTHMLMFGRVVHAESAADSGDPLIYYHRSYRRLAP
jgi:flavin reductase (DIM6/NTAB) family NADH-FMN oxidoreductase RutF